MIFMLIVSNVVYADNECEKPQILQELKAHLNQSIFDDVDHYLIRRSTKFSPFVRDFFKQESRELYMQLDGEKIDANQIQMMQLKRYESIYQTLNQQFVKDFTVPIENNGADSLINIDEDTEPYFRIFPMYEQLLLPVIQLQLKRFNADLLNTVRGDEESQSLGSLEQSFTDENFLTQLLLQKIQIKFEDIKSVKKETHPEGELSICQMKLFLNQKQPIILQYWVNHFSSDNRLYLIANTYKFDQYQPDREAQVAKYLVEKSM